MSARPKAGSATFFFNPASKEILLHKRDAKAPVFPNKWGLFGGAAEGSENAKECALREIKEELGIDIDEKDLILLREYFSPPLDVWRSVYYVKSNMKKSEMTLGEGEGFDWIPLDKVLNYDLTEVARSDLEYFNETLKK